MARKAALLSRFSDAYSQARLDAQGLLRRCIDKAETVQRIIYIATVVGDTCPTSRGTAGAGAAETALRWREWYNLQSWGSRVTSLPSFLLSSLPLQIFAGGRGGGGGDLLFTVNNSPLTRHSLQDHLKWDYTKLICAVSFVLYEHVSTLDTFLQMAIF